MDNHIISILQNFEKTDHNFLKDKECLICLESFDDIEKNKIVQLPCKCSNSAYHINCIIKLINSGYNKNFCPHCKSIYEIPPIQASVNQIVPYNVINIQLGPDINYERTKNFTHILVCHIISNSIMNIINIVASRDWDEVSSLPELQALILFYFFKLFFNYVILMYSKNNVNKIEDCLVYSYVFQIILFCFFVYALTKIKNDDNSTILIVNNVLLNLGDLTFRIIIEYKMRNTVNVV